MTRAIYAPLTFDLIIICLCVIPFYLGTYIVDKRFYKMITIRFKDSRMEAKMKHIAGMDVNCGRVTCD